MIFGTTKLVTPPTIRSISLDEIKQHVGVTSDDHDLEILSLVDAATTLFERLTKTTVRETTFDLRLPWFPQGYIEIPPPTTSVVSISYYDPDDVDTVWDSANYRVVLLESTPSLIRPVSGQVFPATCTDRVDAVRVRYKAGYPSTDAVPELIKTFVKLMVRHWYDNPSAVVTGTTPAELPFSARSIADSFRSGHYADY